MSAPNKKNRTDEVSLELENVDQLSREELVERFTSTVALARSQQSRIAELVTELTNAKLAFANATINQFNQQTSTAGQHSGIQDHSSRLTYAQVTRFEGAPVLPLRGLCVDADPASQVSLESMERLLD